MEHITIINDKELKIEKTFQALIISNNDLLINGINFTLKRSNGDLDNGWTWSDIDGTCLNKTCDYSSSAWFRVSFTKNG